LANYSGEYLKKADPIHRVTCIEVQTAQPLSNPQAKSKVVGEIRSSIGGNRQDVV